MKRNLTRIDQALDRFVADITAIIREHAELVVAETLARRGLGGSGARPRGGRKRRAVEVAAEKKPRARVAEASAPRRRRRREMAEGSPEQLTLF
ncbi:MAG: hypothetical protein DIU78_003100 [Pseudomonadota bacterium]|nr:MAG: hypothetical protein DIU78_05040 [Pseudomonadota bacterium]